MSFTLFHYLEALGYAMLNSIWQAGLLWLFLTGYLKCNAKAHPVQVGAMGFMAMLMSLTGFLFSFIFFLQGDKMGVFVSPTVMDNSLRPMIPYLAMAYVVVLVFNIGQIAVSYLKIRQLKSKWLKRLPGHLKIFVLDAAAYLGIKRKVTIGISERIKSPITFGFLKPVILLPVAAINQLSTQQVEAIILHELSHIKRNDYLVNFISKLIVALMYFNPFIRALDHLQDAERERSADEWVIRFDYNKALYASALYVLAKSSYGITSSMAVAASGNRMALLNRIEWMMGNKKRILPSATKMIGSMLLGGLFFLGSFLNTTRPDDTTKISYPRLPLNSQLPISMASLSSTGNVQEKAPVKPSTSSAKASAAIVFQKETTEEPSGIAQIENPVEDVSTYIFVTAPTVTMPRLSLAEEKKIDEAANVTRKLIVEEKWKQLELTMGDAVTSDQKSVLKHQYIKNYMNEDLGPLKDRLRLNYHNINWDEAFASFHAKSNNIRLDSLQSYFSSLAKDLVDARNQFIHNPHPLPDSLTQVEVLDKNISDLKIALKQLDSLRHKRIIEL